MTRLRVVRMAIRLRHLDPSRRCGHITRRVESRLRIGRSRSRDWSGASGGGGGGGRRARWDCPSSEPVALLLSDQYRGQIRLTRMRRAALHSLQRTRCRSSRATTTPSRRTEFTKRRMKMMMKTTTTTMMKTGRRR